MDGGPYLVINLYAIDWATFKGVNPIYEGVPDDFPSDKGKKMVSYKYMPIRSESSHGFWVIIIHVYMNMFLYVAFQYPWWSVVRWGENL